MNGCLAGATTAIQWGFPNDAGGRHRHQVRQITPWAPESPLRERILPPQARGDHLETPTHPTARSSRGNHPGAIWFVLVGHPPSPSPLGLRGGQYPLHQLSFPSTLCPPVPPLRYDWKFHARALPPHCPRDSRQEPRAR